MKLRREHLYYALAVAVCICGAVLLTYAAPKAIERALLVVAGGPARPVVIAFGDLLGCAVLSLYWGLKRGLFLYAMLTCFEVLVLSSATVRFRDLLYFEDAVPALIATAYVLVFAVRLRPDPAA